MRTDLVFRDKRHKPRRPGMKLIDGVWHEQILQRQVLIPGTRRNFPHPLSMRAIAARKALAEQEAGA